MPWETVIGLEVHVELSTKTKIFCGCGTAFGSGPNSNTCEGCMGLPGTLPVLSKAVCDKAIAAGIALGCKIEEYSVFDRKHYFYPDLSKGYQLSQFFHHICKNGHIVIDTENGEKEIRINRIHIEEDAGKLVHDAGCSLVDGNRGGMALIEIVSEPDIRSADEAEAYIEALRETLVYTGVSDCKMQEGSMRADVNISVHEAGETRLGTRTEIKNMNSIKAIRRAIEYEMERHIDALENGLPLVQETRRWDDNIEKSFAMRNKENAQDYLYFPDPDLLPLYVSEEWIAQIRESLPELPAKKRARYITDFGLAANTAAVLTAERSIAELFEAIVSELCGNAKDAAAGQAGDGKAGEGKAGAKGAAAGLQVGEAAREAANIVTGDILRLIGESGAADDDTSLRAEQSNPANIDAKKLATVISMVHEKKINRAAAREITEAVFWKDADPETYAKEHNLSLISDESGIRAAAEKAIAENPKSVADYMAGKEKAYGFLVGQTMRAFGGKADPDLVNDALRKLLGVAREQDNGDGSLCLAAQQDNGDGSLCLAARGQSASADSPDQDNGDGSLCPAARGQSASADSSAEQDKDYRPPCPAAEQDKDIHPPCPRADTSQPRLKKEVPGPAEQVRQAFESSPLKTSLKYRDMTCGDLRPEHIGQTIRLAGWVMTIRDHGGIVFLDLRDQYGVTQISCTEELSSKVGKEYSVSVSGKVIERDPETYNPNIVTGEVEIRADEIEVLGPCRPVLPFEINQSTETREDLRLKYRYLDLRNPKVKDHILLRGKVIKYLRREMETMGFTEIQTPILANSSPEGARDYLVPSRKHKGKFYALPQAPQQFKQLLMVAGFDRYFQIAPCFRDEDARLDRSPGEFYQLDFEMAYATQEDVFAVAERVLTHTFEQFTDKKVSQPPYKRFTFAESMLKYGTDKPDLRNPLEIIDLSAFFANVDFEPFKGKPVRAIKVPGASGQSKSWFKDMEKFALGIGMKGLGYITVQNDGAYKGPIDKFLSDEQKAELGGLAALGHGDILYFISDAPGKVSGLAGQIRSELGKRLNIIDKTRFDFCFITDYPMYEYNEETGKTDFTHNPFSMPQGEMEALLTKDPLDILAWQYDIVCNGVELSSGAVRNHRPDIMVKAFEIAGYTEKDVEEKFGALYYAFSYGAPPHAGMAPGVSRITMLLAEEENIREVIAFPMNSNAQNLMLGSPGEVTEQQLRDVHIKIRD